MSWFLNFYRSALGKKVVMAATGVILFGWITAHMVGNLKIFLGPQHLNEYAAFLRTMGAPALPNEGLLWVSRVVLVLCAWLHIQAATQLTLMNWKARPIGYEKKDDVGVAATYAARTMRWGGVLIALFVAYHLMHLTLHSVHPSKQYPMIDVYDNVVAGFQVVWVSGFYILAQVALGFHLYHGLWSMFQSTGVNAPKFNSWRRWFATAFALIISIGNISIPAAVLAGRLTLQQGAAPIASAPQSGATHVSSAAVPNVEHQR
jgi:succinate dehydrogenase / fumarate reductase, cytochrome b subunit